MPLAACLTRNLQMDIFDGVPPYWPSNNASSVAMGTPQSDASSPQAPVAAPPAAAGSPSSEVHAAALQHASNSWPQNSALAMVASQPQPLPQTILGGSFSVNPMCPGAGQQQAEVNHAPQFPAISPFSTCSANGLQQAVTTTATAAAPPQHLQAQDRCSLQGAVVAASLGVQQQQHQTTASQSQASHHTLQRAASQEVMDAVDSMDVALLLDTIGAPRDELQDTARKGAEGSQQQQEQQFLSQQQQQQQAEQQSQVGGMCSTSMPSTAVAAAATLAGSSIPSSWAPTAHSAQTQQQQQQQQQQVAFLQQLQQQQFLKEQQQQQAQLNVAAATAGCLVPPQGLAGGFGAMSSEPMAVPSQRQQPAMRSLSGLSCLSRLSQSGLSSSNTDGQQLGSARSSNTMLLQSLEQQMAIASGCGLALTIGGGAQAAGAGPPAAAAGAGWANLEATQLQRQLQRQLQLQQQQQHAAMQYIQQKHQHQQQVAAALAAAQQQQKHQQAMHMLQRSMTDDLPRTSPITIGSGAMAVSALAAATARRDATLRAGLGLSDPGLGLGLGCGRSLTQSPMSLQLPVAAAAFGSSSTCLAMDSNLTGIVMDPSSIAAAAATAAGGGNTLAAAVAGVLQGTPAAPPAAALAAAPLAATRSLDAAASSFGSLPVPVVGSGDSTSVSPSNANTLAGAVTERHAFPLSAQQLMAQQMVLPGSAPPALGLAAAVGGGLGPSLGGLCELSELQLARVSSDGYDAVLGPAAAANASMLGGSLGQLGLGGGWDADTASLLQAQGLDRLDGSLRELDLERAAQLNRYKQKRMRMRALTDGAKKVRYECRKQLADTRPRVRGRFAKAISSDTLMDMASGGAPGAGGLAAATSLPASSSGGNQPTGSAATGSACTAPPGVPYHQTHGGGGGGSWGLGHHAHAGSQPHMQRIDEEGASEGQSPFVAASLPLRQTSRTDLDGPAGEAVAAGDAAAQGIAETAAAAGPDGLSLGGPPGGDPSRASQQQQQQAQAQQYLPDCQQLRRAASSSLMDIVPDLGGAVGGSAPEGLLGACSGSAGAGSNAASGGSVEPGGDLVAGAPQDCVITENDLAALGFDDLTQLSGGFSNAGGNSNEEMDESAAESLHDGSRRTGSGSGSGGARPVQQSSGQVGMPPLDQQPLQQQQLPSLTFQSSMAPSAQFQALRSQAIMAPQLAPPGTCSMQLQLHQQQQQLLQQQQQQQQQQRLSVLDRPIMYGTDRSQFSAAQLSLLDSILTDQYRPSGPGGRH